MRLTTKIALLIIVFGLVLLLFNGQLNEMTRSYLDHSEIVTFEARMAPEQIMQTNSRDLLVDSNHTFQEPQLRYHPFLLFEVKYTLPDRKTREGVILWSQVSGEMVLNTDTWETTHGFQDAILADANRSDFKIMNVIARAKVPVTREQLQRELQVERDIIDPWIESARQKQLIVQRGNEIQLHFQNPRILVTPQTKIAQGIVTKPAKYSQRIAKKFSQKQIEKAAKAAFGTEFTIRNVSELYLPVYHIEVLNPDGSVLTSYWNALTGQRIPQVYTY